MRGPSARCLRRLFAVHPFLIVMPLLSDQGTSSRTSFSRHPLWNCNFTSQVLRAMPFPSGTTLLPLGQNFFIKERAGLNPESFQFSNSVILENITSFQLTFSIKKKKRREKKQPPGSFGGACKFSDVVWRWIRQCSLFNSMASAHLFFWLCRSGV